MHYAENTSTAVPAENSDDDEKGGEARKTSEELEREALEKYRNGKKNRAEARKLRKRPAAADPSGADAVPPPKKGKKTGGAAVAVPKKASEKSGKAGEPPPPSAKAVKLNKKIDMTDVFKKLKKVRKSTVKRNAFNSRAYGPAKSRAVREGADHATASDVGRINCAKASNLYDKLAK